MVALSFALSYLGTLAAGASWFWARRDKLGDTIKFERTEANLLKMVVRLDALDQR
jgi:hypothetical protein